MRAKSLKSILMGTGLLAVSAAFLVPGFRDSSTVDTNALVRTSSPAPEPGMIPSGNEVPNGRNHTGVKADQGGETALHSSTPGERTLSDIPESSFRRGLLELDPETRAKALGQFNDLQVPIHDSASLHVSTCGSLHYACSGVHKPDSAESVFLDESAPQSESLMLSTAASVPVSQPPAYHSKPGAPYAIYLDFNGGVISGTLWNSNYNSGADYDTYTWTKDTDETTFSDEEQAIIREIWQRISEDYAPFNVNVTTDVSFDPDVTGGLNTVGWILFTRDEDRSGAAMPAKGAGGVAWLNVFGNSSYASAYSPALVYADNLGPNIGHFMAEAGAHEMGHNMGLAHDGTSSVEYYAGHGTGETEWAPIMGSSYYENVTTWSKGEYLNANNTQDDLSIIAGKIGTDPDLIGNSRLTATPLILSGSSIEPATTAYFIGDDPNEGIIQSPTDVDFFSFDTSGGSVSITVDPFISEVTKYAIGNNLDVKLTLYDNSGGVVAVADPTTMVAASLSLNLNPGSYTFSVEGTGAGSPLGDPPTGYTSYGSLGMYFISGTIPQFLSVASPYAGSIWQPGQSYEIVWGGTSAGESVSLDLLLNGSFVQNIVSGIDGANTTYLWTVPASLPEGANYTVQLRALGTAEPAESGLFEIREIFPAVVGQTPLEGDVLATAQSSVAILFNDAMDTGSFTIVDDITSFTGPQASDMSASINGYSWSDSNTVLTIDFDPVTTPGFYRMVLSPQILDTNGNPLDQDNDLAPGEMLEDQYALVFEITGQVEGGITEVYAADMSTDPGATLEAGWEWGVPSEGSVGGPDTAYTGTNVLGYNLSGNYEPDISRSVTLPPVNTSGASQVELQFRRWLGVALKDTGGPSTRHADSARVEYSIDGTNWAPLWESSTQIVDTGWTLQSYVLPSNAENQEALLIRFTIETDGLGESFGWNIDDLVVLANTPSQTILPPPPVVVCHTPCEEASGNPGSLFVEYSQPMDPGSFNLADILDFSGPSGAISASGFTWISSTLLRIDFPEQSVDGTYSMVLAPSIADTYGQLVDQNLNLVGGEAVADQYTASFIINNSPLLSPPESWRLSFFETTLNEGEAADDTDFDKDGLVNLMERAHGTDPTKGGSAYRPIQSRRSVDGQTYLTFEYCRLAGGSASGASRYSVNDLTYDVEYTTDLASGWSPAPAAVLSVSPAVDGVETVVVSLTTALQPGQRQFLRLNVTTSNP